VQTHLQSMHCLIDGDGVDFDVEEAERHFQFSCCQGDVIVSMGSLNSANVSVLIA
jgi:hypothetical protein